MRNGSYTAPPIAAEKADVIGAENSDALGACESGLSSAGWKATGPSVVLAMALCAVVDVVLPRTGVKLSKSVGSGASNWVCNGGLGAEGRGGTAGNMLASRGDEVADAATWRAASGNLINGPSDAGRCCSNAAARCSVARSAVLGSFIVNKSTLELL
jgi:hypothetical protein